MQKKYIVRLTDVERETLNRLVKKRRVSSQKVRRAQVLLKADADGPNWTDAEIAEAFDSRTRTVEFIRERLVTEGFEGIRGSTANPKAAFVARLWTESKKPKSLRCGWASHRGGLPTGRCGFLPSKPWHWKSWLRSATKPCVGL